MVSRNEQRKLQKFIFTNRNKAMFDGCHGSIALSTPDSPIALAIPWTSGATYYEHRNLFLQLMGRHIEDFNSETAAPFELEVMLISSRIHELERKMVPYAGFPELLW